MGASCAALAAALAGCGGEDPDAGTNGVGKLPAAKIESKARAAAQRADTVRLSGNVVSQGRTYKLDMRLAKDGAKGELTTKAAAFQLLRVGEALYLKADAAFWAGEKSGTSGRTRPGARPSSAASTSRCPPPTPSTSASAASPTRTPCSPACSGCTASWRPVTAATSTASAPSGWPAGAGSGGTLDVSLEGTPYPLRLQRAGGAGVVRLADWGKSVDLKAPAKDQVVDYGTQDRRQGLSTERTAARQLAGRPPRRPHRPHAGLTHRARPAPARPGLRRSSFGSAAGRPAPGDRGGRQRRRGVRVRPASCPGRCPASPVGSSRSTRHSRAQRSVMVLRVRRVEPLALEFADRGLPGLASGRRLDDPGLPGDQPAALVLAAYGDRRRAAVGEPEVGQRLFAGRRPR